jgi:hypothetical protein
MMKKLSWLPGSLLFLAFVASPAGGADLYGTVAAAADLSLIPGASVVLRGPNAFQRTAVTDHGDRRGRRSVRQARSGLSAAEGDGGASPAHSEGRPLPDPLPSLSRLLAPKVTSRSAPVVPW